MPHPLALTGRANGANGMKAGDRVICVDDGRRGVADEFLQDGDTYITLDDGTHTDIKWSRLFLEADWDRMLARDTTRIRFEIRLRR